MQITTWQSYLAQVFQTISFIVGECDLCECIPRSLLLPCHGQATQAAACPARAYKNVPLLFDVIIFAAGQKKFPMLRGFLDKLLKNRFTESHHKKSSCSYEKLPNQISLFTALPLPFLPFVPNKPEMRTGNYNYPESCETMKKLFL